MGLIDTEAIVLRTYKLAEADKIVVCLTRGSGLIRAVAHGARRLKSRFGASLEPFTALHLSYYEKEGRELVTLQQAEILRSYFDLAGNADTVAALSYMSELVMQFAPPHEPNEKLYRMMSACLEAIASAPSELRATAQTVRYFEVWLLKLSGFLPETRLCAECGGRFSEEKVIYFNAELKLRCDKCSNEAGTPISKETHAQLRAIQRLPPSEFARSVHGTADAARSELARFTQRLIERALEREPPKQAFFNIPMQ